MMERPSASKTATNVVRAVMTDQQLETLSKQIAVYQIISKQLFQTYKTFTATSQTQTVVVPSERTMLSSISGQKSKRPRWNPTTNQLRILESIFSKNSELPSKQKIREIAAELSRHGLVSDTNVYNWFQNKRARSKRKCLQKQTLVRKGDDSEESSEGSQFKNDGETQMKNVSSAGLDRTRLSSSLAESESPSCRVENLSHEINAELMHFINSPPPELESIFSSSGGDSVSKNTGS